MDRPHVVHLILSLGVGGDAKNLCALARQQAKWARVSVLTQACDPGERTQELTQEGISVTPGMVDPAHLQEWIKCNTPHLATFHRNGAPDEKETLLLETFHHANIPCFEYNTFAKVDRTTDELWAGHFHLSRASLTQYARRRGVSPNLLPNHAAVGYAVEIPAPITRAERNEARRLLQLPEDCFVVLRLMRPDLRKWDPLPVLAVQRLRSAGKDVRLIVRSVPCERRAWVKHILGDYCRLLAPSLETSSLRQTLAAADVILNYSAIGETFGLGLAEGMAVGLPIIVNSTPKADNAQVELCEHGRTGLIANSVGAVSTAIEDLHQDNARRLALGQQAREFMIRKFSPEVVEARVRRFFLARLGPNRRDLSAAILQPPEDDDYSITSEWLDWYDKQEHEGQSKQPASVRDLVDEAYIRCLKLQDLFLYASSIGPRATVEKLKRRLSQGSLLRS